MSQSLGDIRKLLEQGFFLDNLRLIASRAVQDIPNTDHPLPLFVISRIFLSLDAYWRERPLTVETANAMRDAIQPSIFHYLDSLTEGLTAEQELLFLDAIIDAFSEWEIRQKAIPYGQ